MNSLRAMARRDIVAICVVIFLADVVWSILTPTFSLFAQGLGASLAFIGVLNSLTGLTQFLAAVPVGIRSDVWGRRFVIFAGALIMAASCVLHATAAAPGMLVLARVLFALGTVMTFPTATVLMADVTQPQERGTAFGLLTTVMSLGATIGALLAAWLEPRISFGGTYWVAATLGLICAACAWFLLPRLSPTQAAGTARPFNLASMLPLLRRPPIAFVSLINFCMSTCFAGVLMSFFPILAASRGATSSEVSTYFSLRSIGSTFTRLPIGMLSNRLPRGPMLGFALAVVATLLLGMSATTTVAVMAALLVIEGIAFGTNLTVGQAFVAGQVSEQERATAIGLYNTAGSLGATLSPLLLGALAERAGVPSVFVVVAIFSFVTLVAGAVQLRRTSTASVPVNHA